VTGVTVIHGIGVQGVPTFISDLGPAVCPDCFFVRQMLGCNKPHVRSSIILSFCHSLLSLK
jgi:hypothetical protein